MIKLFTFCRWAVFAVLLLVGLHTVQAQTNQGQIAGNVVDSTGAAVPNAPVEAKSEETGSVYNAISSSAGSYRFPSIQLGRYTVTVTAPGFKPSQNTGVEVRVGTTTSLDLTVSAGGANETVTVAADAPAVETQSSEIGGTVNTRQITELPLALGGVGAMRSPEAFVFLIPGTAGPGTGNSQNGIFVSKIGGGQNFGNEVLLDGASQTRSENGSSFDEEAPSVEAISEFKVTTNSPPAEFGRTTGGIENFVTKSGTNKFHGTAFDIFRNEALDANEWFNNGRKAYYQSVGRTVDANNNQRSSDKQNDYGGTFGGPVYIPHIYNGHDKSFFFFAWEQFRQVLGGVATNTIPTVAERSGDFRDRLIGGATGQINPCDGTPIQNGQIFDPATTRSIGNTRCRTAFLNNVIPAGRFSPVAQKIIAFYPQPTNGALTNNYSLRSSSLISNTTYTIRIDHSIGQNDKIYGSYSSRENTRNNPTFLFLPPPVDPNTQTQDFITHFGRGGWDHTFSPNILNHLNLGYNRSNSINGSIEALSGINYAQQLGIANIQTGFPRINVDGYLPLSRNQLGDNIDNGIRVNDSVSWQKGRNSFKFGFDYRYQQYSSIAQDNINGNFNFSANQTRATDIAAASTGSGNAFASLVLGNYDFGGTTIPTHQPRWISNYWAGFIQDDLKLTNSLVLNIGLRYDVDQPRREATNSTSNFNPTLIDPRSGTPGALEFGTTCTNCNKRWADTWFKDIAPRIGFAYSPSNWSGKLAIRGGFSTLYGPLQYNDFGGSTIAGYSNIVQQPSNGFDPSFNIDGGLKPYPTGANLSPAFYDSGNASSPLNLSNYIKPSYGRPAQVNQWNLQVQQELTKDLIFTLGYIGSSSSHLRSGIENINNISKSQFSRGDGLSSFDLASNAINRPYAGFNGRVFQSLRPFPQYGYIATDCCLQNVGHSSFEALVASLERRFSNGLNLQSSYTWSKTVTNADSALPGINGGVSQVQDPFNAKAEKALSIQDIPNTFVFSSIYELPFGKNKNFLNHGGFLTTLVSGFELGGVLRYQSGQPTSFGRNPNGSCGGATGIPGWDNCLRYQRVVGSSFASPARRGRIDPFRVLRAGSTTPLGPDPNVDSEFNGLLRRDNPGYSGFQTAPAFYDQNQGPNRILRARLTGQSPAADNGDFQLGNIPRVTGEIRNYRYANEDLSFLKKTPIGESTTFFFKVELINAFNRHTFSTPDTNPNSLLFGVPTGTIQLARKMQLTARIQF